MILSFPVLGLICLNAKARISRSRSSLMFFTIERDSTPVASTVRGEKRKGFPHGCEISAEIQDYVYECIGGNVLHYRILPSNDQFTNFTFGENSILKIRLSLQRS